MTSNVIAGNVEVMNDDDTVVIVMKRADARLFYHVFSCFGKLAHDDEHQIYAQNMMLKLERILSTPQGVEELSPSDKIRRLTDELEVMKARIGNGGEQFDLSNLFLEMAPNDTLTGQGYEGLHFAYAALERAIDSMYDVAGNMETKVIV